MSTFYGPVQTLQLWSFALTLTVLMKRIKQEQHIEIQEKSQQLKFRMQTEIQINKHHALCQASDQLEELDYTKLYFAYSGIRKSQIEPRVLFKVLVCAYIKGVYSSRKIVVLRLSMFLAYTSGNIKGNLLRWYLP